MRPYQLNNYINNSSVSNSIKSEYKKEVELAKKKFGKPFYLKLKDALINILFPGGIVYTIVVGGFLFMWLFCDYYMPFNHWLDEHDTVAKIYIIIALILLVIGVVLTFKSFFYIVTAFSDAFRSESDRYYEEKRKITLKYNEMGYYPQYEKISDCIEIDGHCVYYDDNRDVFLCPIDNSLVSSDRTNYKCFSLTRCYECEKLKKFMNGYYYE